MSEKCMPASLAKEARPTITGKRKFRDRFLLALWIYCYAALNRIFGVLRQVERAGGGRQGAEEGACANVPVERVGPHLAGLIITLVITGLLLTGLA